MLEDTAGSFVLGRGRGQYVVKVESDTNGVLCYSSKDFLKGTNCMFGLLRMQKWECSDIGNGDLIILLHHLLSTFRVQFRSRQSYHPRSTQNIPCRCFARACISFIERGGGVQKEAAPRSLCAQRLADPPSTATRTSTEYARHWSSFSRFTLMIAHDSDSSSP